jgi:hypothetical protein
VKRRIGKRRRRRVMCWRWRWKEGKEVKTCCWRKRRRGGLCASQQRKEVEEQGLRVRGKSQNRHQQQQQEQEEVEAPGVGSAPSLRHQNSHPVTPVCHWRVLLPRLPGLLRAAGQLPSRQLRFH